MTDEQRVAEWAASMRRDGYKMVTTLQVQTLCVRRWEIFGDYRMPSTMLRAFWRARSAGMLGPIEEPIRKKGRLYYRLGSVAHIRRAAGKGYKTIPHGNRTRKGGDAA